MKSLMQHAAVNSCAVPIGQVYTILHEFIITRRYDTDIVWNVQTFLSPYVGVAIPVFPSCVFGSCAGRFTIFPMSQRPFEVWRVRLCGWPGRREWHEWWCQWHWCCLADFVGRMLWGEVVGPVLYPKTRLRDGMGCEKLFGQTSLDKTNAFANTLCTMGCWYALWSQCEGRCECWICGNEPCDAE